MSPADISGGTCKTPLRLALEAMHLKLPVCLVKELTRNLRRLSAAGLCRAGTLSSGTDICMKVFEELVDYWHELYDIKVPLSQVFAVESDKAKASWLAKQISFKNGRVQAATSSNTCIYYDNSAMCNSNARCRVHEHQTTAGCCVKHCRVVTAGFTCKSRSSLNCRVKETRGCVQSGTDLTGESWAAVYGFLLAHHPDAFIGENVMNLNSEVPGSDETDAQYITRKLREAGYGAVEMMVLDAPRFGSRALRRRLYWLALLGEDRGRGALLQTMIKAMEIPEAHSVGRLATKIVSCVSS